MPAFATRVRSRVAGEGPSWASGTEQAWRTAAAAAAAVAGVSVAGVAAATRAGERRPVTRSSRSHNPRR
eukprot:428165-Prymnesium_polylepis.2